MATRRDEAIYRALIEYGTRNHKGFAVKIKEESSLMRLAAWFSFWNPQFLSSFATTVGSTIYVPRSWLADAAAGKTEYPWRVLAHELVHVADKNEMVGGFFAYGLWYFTPQVWAVLALLAIPLALALGPGWWALLSFLLLLAPIPSLGRMRYEKRGYAMSLATIYWTHGAIEQSQKDHVVRQFVSANYWFMWPFEQGVRGWIEMLQVELVRRTAIDSYGKVFADVHQVLMDNGVPDAE